MPTPQKPSTGTKTTTSHKPGAPKPGMSTGKPGLGSTKPGTKKK